MKEASSKKEKKGQLVPPDPKVELTGIEAPTRQLPLELSPITTAGFFYVLPRALLTNAALNSLSDDDNSREVQLADFCGKHRSPGVFQRLPIRYDHLEAQEFPAVDISRLGLSPEHAESYNESLRPLARLAETSRGYVGWLTTNRQFQQEQDDLITRWEPVIRTNGFPGPLISATSVPDECRGTVDSKLLNFVLDYDAFCIRWRLNAIVGPDLPVPMQPMLAGQVSISVLGQLLRNGGIFHYPDTFPIDSRDFLRSLLESGLGRDSITDAGRHLAEWHKIVRSDNSSRNQIARFARIRTFIHIWRLLRARMVEFHVTSIQGAIAHYLGVAETTISNDRSFIDERLGPDWDQRLGPMCVNS